MAYFYTDNKFFDKKVEASDKDVGTLDDHLSDQNRSSLIKAYSKFQGFKASENDMKYEIFDQYVQGDYPDLYKDVNVISNLQVNEQRDLDDNKFGRCNDFIEDNDSEYNQEIRSFSWKCAIGSEILNDFINFGWQIHSN